MIYYQEISPEVLSDELLSQVKIIYASENWSAYLQDDAKLERAFKQSLYLLGAFSGEQLIGFVRCVGDGEHVILVQDLIVHADYQKKGIGTTLFQKAQTQYKDVRQFFVVTDLYSSHLHMFYQSMGMEPLEKVECISFIRNSFL